MRFAAGPRLQIGFREATPWWAFPLIVMVLAVLLIAARGPFAGGRD